MLLKYASDSVVTKVRMNHYIAISNNCH